MRWKPAVRACSACRHPRGSPPPADCGRCAPLGRDAADHARPAMEPMPPSPEPAATLQLLHIDDALAVVNKPAGLMVHDSKLAGGESDFLVHRLDRATSGCLLLAFDRDTASQLGQVLMSRGVDKHYWAVCRGWPEENFVVDHPLDGGPGKPQKKPAITRFTRLATCELARGQAGSG